MKTRSIFATLVIPATALGLFAQNEAQQEKVTAERHFAAGVGEPVIVAQGAIRGMISLPDEPGVVEFMRQEFSGRTVTNAPYSAEEKTETVQTLADGTRITNTTTAHIYRDSLGRTRREMPLPAFGGDTQTRTLITIFDPVAGASFTLDPENKVAHKMPMPIGAAKLIAVDKMKAEAEAMGRETKSSRTANMTYRVTRSKDAAAVQRDDLGTSTLEGVNAKGVRETSTIAVGSIGNDRPIVITSERWESPELQLEVKSVRNDPRMGETTHTLTNISRAEPDASLFQVPGDYKVDEGKSGFQKFEFHTNQ